MSSPPQKPSKKHSGAELVGQAAGIAQAGNIYAENVSFQASQGHGFAAENANHLFDILTGQDATIIGGDNAKDGADRLVNGVQIQTKYCATASRTVSECFHDNQFRYYNPDGSPMQIEVPFDQYDDAIRSFQTRIEKGQVRNISDPEKAKDIIRQGQFTYEQAKNIARFGTIEGITYDAIRGIQVAGWAGGISALISFGTAIWRGDDMETAIQNAVYSGLKVGGISWVSSILTAQVGRTSLELGLRGATDWVVKQLGAKTTAMLANAMRAGNNIYGAAAANHLSKILRGNIVTGVIVTGVLSTADFIRLFQGKVSAAQVFKNISKTAASVAGGTAGWMGGAAIGASIGSAIPIVGTAAGGIIGGIIGAFGGGYASQEAASALLDVFIEDDAVEMLDIFQEVFSSLAFDYLLSEEEASQCIESLQKEPGFETIVQKLYQSEDRKQKATEFLLPIIEKRAKERDFIPLPNPDKFMHVLGQVIQEL